MTPPAYACRRTSHSETLTVRGLACHLRHWGDPSLATPAQPPLLMLHGWMDVGASFQFIVDALEQLGSPARHVIAPDWRGFGLSEATHSDSYWFADYLGDLDAIVDAVLAASPGLTQLDLLGHSMGGNVAMIYAGVRPERIRRLVNLEGFGMPATRAEMAPKRYADWLDELKTPQQLFRYGSLEAVAQRLQKNNPRLPADRAVWLAAHWAKEDGQGRWQILGDPAHKRINPMLYQRDEALACWAQIRAPLLWAEGDQTEAAQWWRGRYSGEEFHERLRTVPRVEKQVLSPAGHMLHHDQREALARLLDDFLSR